MEYLKIANSPIFWILCLPVGLLVLIQAYIFSKKAIKSAELVDLSKSDAKKAFKIGAVSSIGPALGVFVVMLGLMSVIGGPLAWMRLAIIGSAPAELAASSMAAKAMGVELGGKGYNLVHFANAAWVMALNGSAWLLTTGLFSYQLDRVTKKVSGGDVKKLGVISIAAMCGSFAYLFGSELMKGFNTETRPFMVSAIGAAVVMIVLTKISEKYPKFKEYTLGIAMLAGMLSAVIYIKLGGM